jgi:hypothetical protein
MVILCVAFCETFAAFVVKEVSLRFSWMKTQIFTDLLIVCWISASILDSPQNSARKQKS